MFFQFNDEKSRRQINSAITWRNDTNDQNARRLAEYYAKRVRMVGDRGAWEDVSITPVEDDLPVVDAA